MKLKGNFIINKKDNQIQFSGKLDQTSLQNLLSFINNTGEGIRKNETEKPDVQTANDTRKNETEKPVVQKDKDIHKNEVDESVVQKDKDIHKNEVDESVVQKDNDIHKNEVDESVVQKDNDTRKSDVDEPILRKNEPIVGTQDKDIRKNEPVVYTQDKDIHKNDHHLPSMIKGWESHKKYTKDDIVIYKKKTYICLFDHTSLPNWAPESSLDVLWSTNVNVKELVDISAEKKSNITPPQLRFMIVSIGDIITIPYAQFYETNNPKIFQILPQNRGVKVIGVGQGCIRFNHQQGFSLDHIIGIFVKGFESGASINRALIGSISDDDLNTSIPFWLDFNNYCDIRYTFLNGGPDKFGWKLNYSTQEYNTEPLGNKAISFIRNSQHLGITPLFVYNNLGNQFQMKLVNINSIGYMISYYTDLEFLLDLINKESPNLPTWIIFEPDFIGELIQNDNLPSDFVHTSPLKMLNTVKELAPSLVPTFDSTLSGFVKSINWLVKFKCPQVHFGWQVNLMTSRKNTSIPGNKGLMKVSDFIGIDNAKTVVISHAKEISRFCVSMGVNFLTDFFAVDKKGISFRGTNAESLRSVESSVDGWNSDHWYNYLLFCMTLKSTLNKNCILWRLPTGHLNCSRSINPKTRAPFKELQNIPGEYEDTAVTFFFGDSFVPKDPDEYAYFLQNKFDSELVESDGHGTIIWKGIADDLKDYGISGIIFGTESPIDTHSGGLSKKISDDNFFFNKVKKLIS